MVRVSVYWFFVSYLCNQTLETYCVLSLKSNFSQNFGFHTENMSPNLSSTTVLPKKAPYYFCGVKKIEANVSSRHRRYVLQGSKWKKLDLTWAITIESSRDEIRSIATREFIKATELWSRASRLTFRRVSPFDKNIDILVHFVTGNHDDGWNFDGEGGTLAHAFYPGTSLTGDVHFDDTENFISHRDVLDGKDGVDLFVVAAHELGHSLGLYHSNSETALMAPFYQPMKEDSELPEDDKRAIGILYGRREDDRVFTHWPPARPIDTTPRLPPPTTTSSTRRPPPTTPRPQWTTPYPPWPSPVPERTTPRFTTPQYSESTPHYRTTEHWTTQSRTTPTPVQPPITTEFTPIDSSCTLLPPSDSVDICNATFDAAFHLTETFFFSGEYMWRIWYERKQISQHKIYNSLDVFRKNNIRKVDAACITNREILFFSGPNITRYSDGNSEVYTLESIGLYGIDKVDAAWTWGHNGYTYIISGENYWRLNANGKVEPDYPRSASVWQGLPKNVGAAITIDGLTYFFAGNVFYTFSNLDMKAASEPMLTAPHWLGCPHPDFNQVVQCSYGPSFDLSYYLLLLCAFINEYHTSWIPFNS